MKLSHEGICTVICFKCVNHASPQNDIGVRQWCKKSTACQKMVQTFWKWANGHPWWWSHWLAQRIKTDVNMAEVKEPVWTA